MKNVLLLMLACIGTLQNINASDAVAISDTEAAAISSLMLAIRNDDMEAFQQGILMRLPLYESSEGKLIMHELVQHGREAMAQYLIEQNGNIRLDIVNADGLTPILLGLSRSHDEYLPQSSILRTLLSLIIYGSQKHLETAWTINDASKMNALHYIIMRQSIMMRQIRVVWSSTIPLFWFACAYGAQECFNISDKVDKNPYEFLVEHRKKIIIECISLAQEKPLPQIITELQKQANSNWPFYEYDCLMKAVEGILQIMVQCKENGSIEARHKAVLAAKIIIPAQKNNMDKITKRYGFDRSEFYYMDAEHKQGLITLMQRAIELEELESVKQLSDTYPFTKTPENITLAQQLAKQSESKVAVDIVCALTQNNESAQNSGWWSKIFRLKMS